MSRPVRIALTVALGFATTIGAFWAMLPVPRRKLDYFVMGAAGSMVALIILFAHLFGRQFKKDVTVRRKTGTTE
ncbi:MAG: hypothetical protein HYZ37_19225 [Candidatus Solibacter usitatus]|nr:hypothetical protein [Candidatus Solibacter usitatus]